MEKFPITTHVLDLDKGRPAAGMVVSLLQLREERAQLIARQQTDADGRIINWHESFVLQGGTYELRFAAGKWFAEAGRDCFYPEIRIAFSVVATSEHYHVPLLMTAYGYSTYRGS